jgi:ribonuclease BN (tRNA processing enzyme)
LILLMWLALGLPLARAADHSCGDGPAVVEVLGSGGPEMGDGRASSGYLVWMDGKARVLVDMGSGSMLNFEQSGADLTDLDVVLLSHLHVDHAVELPTLVKASFFTDRRRDLPVWGPTGNQLMPPTRDFVQILFGPEGAYRYLSDFLDGDAAYRLLPGEVDAGSTSPTQVFENERFRVLAVGVNHGPIPALAWRVETGQRTIVFSGDTSNSTNTLGAIADGADLLVAHHAIPESAEGIARKLHMPPSEIGRVAGEAKVGALVLSHRMKRTLGLEAQTLELIRRSYGGPVTFAEDMACF